MAVEQSTLAEVPPQPNPYLVLLTVSACTLLYSISITVVNVVLPQLQGALGATPDQVSWVVTLNVVGTTVFTPLTGWLTAKLGQRNLMLASVVGFAVSSFLCSTATSLGPMLVYRVAQGAFGAPIVPLAQAVILAAFPGANRAMAQAVFGIAVVSGMGVAPVLGGYVAEIYDWRAVFVFIVPCSVLALLMTVLFLRQGSREAALRLDWTGFLSLSIGLACMQLVLDRGERFGWLDSPSIILYLAVMSLCFYVFVVHTMTAERSFLNRELLRNRNFTLGLVFVAFYGMLNLTPMTLLPPLLQNLKGYPDSLIGWLLAMRGIGMVVGFYVAGRMGRIDPRISMTFGFLLVGASGLMLSFIDLNVSAERVAWAGIVQGFGSGVLWVPVTTAAFWSLPERLLPDGAAIYHLLRNIGTSVHVSLAFLIVLRTSQINYADLVVHVNPMNELLRYEVVTGMWNVETTGGLRAIAGEIGRQAQMIGFNNALLFYAASSFAAIPFVLLWRPTRR